MYSLSIPLDMCWISQYNESQILFRTSCCSYKAICTSYSFSIVVVIFQYWYFKWVGEMKTLQFQCPVISYLGLYRFLLTQSCECGTVERAYIVFEIREICVQTLTPPPVSSVIFLVSFINSNLNFQMCRIGLKILILVNDSDLLLFTPPCHTCQFELVDLASGWGLPLHMISARMQ